MVGVANDAVDKKKKGRRATRKRKKVLDRHWHSCLRYKERIGREVKAGWEASNTMT